MAFLSMEKRILLKIFRSLHGFQHRTLQVIFQVTDGFRAVADIFMLILLVQIAYDLLRLRNILLANLPDQFSLRLQRIIISILRLDFHIFVEYRIIQFVDPLRLHGVDRLLVSIRDSFPSSADFTCRYRIADIHMLIHELLQLGHCL